MEAQKKRSGSHNNDGWIPHVAYKQVGSDPPTLYYNISSQASADNGWFVGYDIPDFYARKRRGELLPMTPFRQFHVSGSSAGNYDVLFETGLYDTRYYTSNTYCWLYTSSWLLSELDLSQYVPVSYDAYVQEAAAKIYSSGHDSLTFLSELHKVRELFVKAGKTALSLGRPKTAKGLANDYLSFRYGWRTLVYDLQDLNDAIRNFDDKLVRRSERAGTTYSTSNVEEWTSMIVAGEVEHVLNDSITIGLRGGITADIIPPRFQFNPFITAWELTRYSFVIDWLLSVGNAIAAVSFLCMNASHTAYKGYKITVDRQYSNSLSIPAATVLEHDVRQMGSSHAELSVRVPCGIPIHPSIALRLDNLKILDLLALIVQKLH